MDVRIYPGGQSAAPGETSFWPVSWSAVWVGALAALAVALVTGLAGIAVGAQVVGHGENITSWNKVHFGGIIWTVCSAFFSFAVGGWVAGKITGHPRAEPAMLHGAITWLVTVPMLLILAALGAGGYFGAWYTGLAGNPAWVQVQAQAVNPDAYAIVRNNALGALTALILGLIGSVIGSWMASGEPMSLFHDSTQSSTSSAVPMSGSKMTGMPTT